MTYIGLYQLNTTTQRGLTRN